MVQLLSKKEVLKRIGVTYPTIWNWMRAGVFPRSVVLQPGQKYSRVGWFEKEVDEWCDARERSVFVGEKRIKKKEGRER